MQRRLRGGGAMKATARAMKASRELRRRMSKPEVLLWQLLRRSPAGARFRRQYAIGPYIADFYCPTAKLVIEIDGQIHDFDGQAQHDAARDKVIAGYGVCIQRIAARDVLKDPAAVASALVEMCARPLHHPAAPDGPPPHGSAAGRIN